MTVQHVQMSLLEKLLGKDVYVKMDIFNKIKILLVLNVIL